MEPLNYLKIGNEKLKEAKLYDALTFYNKALSLEPNDISALISKGIILKLTNNNTYSQIFLEKAYNICADKIEERNKYIELWIERAFFSELRDHEIAILLYEYADALLPNDIFVLGRLLMLYKCAGNESKEIDILQKLNATGQTNYLSSVIRNVV